jgi:hypothetical protein
MKCIYCGTDSRLRDRTGGRCPKCQHAFAFEPTKDSLRVTDAHFKHAIERVSGGGKVRFTGQNLWYELNRPWMKPDAWGRVVSMFSRRRGPPQPRPPRHTFAGFQQSYLRRWREVHGEVAGLLPVREVAAPGLPAAVPADVAAFSFDRVVVTDRWDTAQLLVANRFHFEHSCAVLSRDGYPDGTAETVKEMLRRNPGLTVFALHDASPGGCLLPLTLRDPEWFPGPSIRIVDLGLDAGMAERLRIPALRGSSTQVPPRLAEKLSAKDMFWLAQGHTAELAVLRPAQLLRAVYHGIVAAGLRDRGSSSGSDGGGGGGDGGGVIWVGDLNPGADTAVEDGFG